MCILISLTNHITTAFWSDHFYMPKHANIWQKRLRRGSNVYLDWLLADYQSYYCKFLIRRHILTKTSQYLTDKSFAKVEFFSFLHVSLQFLDMSRQNVVIWLVKLIKMHILTNFHGLLSINERETSENLRKLTHCAAFSVTYWPVLAWKWGRIKKLNKR